MFGLASSSKGKGRHSGKESSSSNKPSRRVAAKRPSASADIETTFGVELEFVVCIRKEEVPQGSDEEFFRWATARLNAQPALANRVLNSLARGRSIQYNNWNLIADSSISGRPDWGATLHGLSEMDARYAYACQGMELVSPVYEYSNIDSFERKLTAVKDAFRRKAFNNETTALHVHMGIPLASSNNPLASGLTLEVVRVLFLLWAASEQVIEGFQPDHRHGEVNSHCYSLFDKIKRDRGDLVTRRDRLVLMAQQLWSCTSRGDIIRNVVGGTPGYCDKKLNISFENTRKPTTIEFREHFGTLARQDIMHWIKFCHKMLQFAYDNRNRAWTNEWLDNLFERTRSLSQVVTLIGISTGDAGFLRDRRDKVGRGDYDRVVLCQ